MSSSPTTEAYRAIRDDASLFAERLLRRYVWSKQREVMQALSRHEKVAVASCHSVGKSFLADCCLLWFAYTRRPSVVVTTAPTWPQVENVIWRYVAREYARLPKDLQALARLTKTGLDFGGDHYAVGRSTDKPDNFQGFHSENIMLIVDEAAGVEDDIFEAADTLSAGGNFRELLLGNPTSTEGRFYRAFHNEALGYHCIRIDALDTPNFTGEPCPPEVAKQLIQASKVEEWKATWGEDSPAFQSRVHARFPSQDEQSVIAPLQWFLNAQKRDPAKLPSDVAQIGVDVARYGADNSCFAEAVGANLTALSSTHGKDTTQIARMAREKALDLHGRTKMPVTVNIDETGVGAGVVDQCKGYSTDAIRFVGVNFGSAANDPGRFDNLRAEMYWNVRELLRQGNNEPDLAVTATGPEVERLGAQLSAIKYLYTGREKVKVESKEDMRKRGMPSPDEADAVVLAFHRGPKPTRWYT